MSSFDYSNIPMPMANMGHTFIMIFNCPSLTTKVKEDFLLNYYLNYLRDQTFREQEYGKYLVFVGNPFQFLGTFSYEELKEIKERKLLFKITDVVDFAEKIQNLTHTRCNNTIGSKGRNFVICTFSLENTMNEEDVLYQCPYLADSGSTHTELLISDFLDYSSLFFTTNIPVISELQRRIYSHEYVPVQTSNGIIYKLLILLNDSLYVRVGCAEAVELNNFICDIPNVTYNGMICFPGRFFLCCKKQNNIPNDENDQDYPLLGTNVMFNYLSTTIPLIQDDEESLRKGFLKSQLSMHKINRTDDSIVYELLILKRGLILHLLSQYDNKYV